MSTLLYAKLPYVIYVHVFETGSFFQKLLGLDMSKEKFETLDMSNQIL